MSIIIQRQRVTQLVQITSQIVLTRSLFKFENHTLVHRYFMSVFYLGDKDGLDVQQLRSNVLAVDATLSQAPSAKDLPVPGRSVVACSEPRRTQWRLRVPFMGFVLICRSGCEFRRTGCNASVSGYTIAGDYPTVTLVQARRCNCCLSGYYGTVAGTGFPESCHHFCSKLIM